MNFQPESLPLLYKTLISESRPIFLYGTGDGADKILDTLARFSIPVAGVFVSEEFYRGQTFRGSRRSIRPMDLWCSWRLGRICRR